MIGFSYYDEPPSTTPTTQEILAALTAGQKTGIVGIMIKMVMGEKKVINLSRKYSGFN